MFGKGKKSLALLGRLRQPEPSDTSRPDESSPSDNPTPGPSGISRPERAEVFHPAPLAERETDSEEEDEEDYFAPRLRWYDPALTKLGFCSCKFHEITGERSICRYCKERRSKKYMKLEEDYRLEGADALVDVTKGTVITLYDNTEMVHGRRVAVSLNMDALNVIYTLAAQEHIRGFYDFHVMEYWQELDADRTIEDHERLLKVRIDQLKSNHGLYFIFEKNLEKYDSFKLREEFFIHPVTAREKNAKYKQRSDPRLIQVTHEVLVTPPEDPVKVVIYSSGGTPTEETSRVEPISEVVVPISSQAEASTVQVSKGKGQLQAVSEDPLTTPPKPVQQKLEVEGQKASSSKTPSPEPEETLLSPNISSVEMSSQPSPEPSIGREEEDAMLNPIFCSTVFVWRVDPEQTMAHLIKRAYKGNRPSWTKKYLLLRDRKLFFVDTMDHMLKYYYMDDEQFSEKVENVKGKKDKSMLKLIGSVHKFELYRSLKVRYIFGAPQGGCLLLRTTQPARNQLKMIFCSEPFEDYKTPDNSSIGRKLWLMAFGLAKHGSILVENYREYLEARTLYQHEVTTEKDVVPMDFSSGRGRIVEDAETIEQMMRESRGRPMDRFKIGINSPPDALEHGRHLTQKYYHGHMTRNAAEKLIIKHFKNGRWLLRSGGKRPGTLSLSYAYNNRIFHKTIYATPYEDQSSNPKKQIYVVTMDNMLAFYDVHSLIEYYRLNRTPALECMLGPSIKKESQRDNSPRRNLILPEITEMESQVVSQKRSSSGSFPGMITQSFRKSMQKLKPKTLSLDPAVPPTTKLVSSISKSASTTSKSAPTTSKSSPMEPPTSRSSPLQLSTSRSSPMQLSTPKSSPIEPSTTKSSPIGPSTTKSSPMEPSTAKSSPMEPSSSGISMTGSTTDPSSKT